jgi:hypothetical protein
MTSLRVKGRRQSGHLSPPPARNGCEILPAHIRRERARTRVCGLFFDMMLLLARIGKSS